MRTTARGLLLLAGLLVAAFTLGATPSTETDLFTRLVRAVLGALTPLPPERLSGAEVEALANALLFLPLGLLLPLAFPRAPLTLLLAVPVAATLGVEVAQLLVLESRTPDGVDVLANTAGGAVGLLLGADVVRAAGRRSRPSPG